MRPADHLSEGCRYLAPDAYDADTVFACGDWSVIPTGDGWYGWTPNSAEERSTALAG